jgi:hypothetical protein
MPLIYIKLHWGSVCELQERARSKANYKQHGYSTYSKYVNDKIVPMVYCIYFSTNPKRQEKINDSEGTTDEVNHQTGGG